METLNTNPARRVPALDAAGDPRVVDVRDPGPLGALREAYGQRLALLARHAPDEDLARNAHLVRSLEGALRPGRVRLRRSGPDPAIFLG
ncbi:hypothetical protein [Kineococcus arenarius]|uniref:hypothetical protein n=1 Tax=unclassified Kineococcus TaxID=2621656 RepID=UPI003D7C5A1B